MRWFIILGMLVGIYYYFLTNTANVVLGQMQQLQAQYTYVENHAEELTGLAAK